MQIPANLLLVKNMTVHGIFWGSYLLAQPRALLEGMTQVLKWLSEGMLEVQVGGGGLTAWGSHLGNSGGSRLWSGRQLRCGDLLHPLSSSHG